MPEPKCASGLFAWLMERIAVLGREGECYHVLRSVSTVIYDKFYPTANVGSLAKWSIEISDKLIRDCAEHLKVDF